MSLPTVATVQFWRFFEFGRLHGVFSTLVVVGLCTWWCCMVFQEADRDAAQMVLTHQLLDAVLGELASVAQGQPALFVGDFNVEPTKIPCLSKGISARLWIDLEAAWAGAAGVATHHHLQALSLRYLLLLVPSLAAMLIAIGGFSHTWQLERSLALRGGHVRLLSLWFVLLCVLDLGCLLWIRVGEGV